MLKFYLNFREKYINSLRHLRIFIFEHVQAIFVEILQQTIWKFLTISTFLTSPVGYLSANG